MTHHIYFHESSATFELVIKDNVAVDAKVVNRMLSELLSHPKWSLEVSVLGNHQNISFGLLSDDETIAFATLTIHHLAECPPKKGVFL